MLRDHEYLPEWSDDEPTLPGGARPRPRVLVVDADETECRAVTARLERDGYEVYPAAAPDHVLGLLDGPADLVIADWRAAPSVIRAVRARGWDIPALIVTAFAEPGVVDAVGRMGAFLLLKPFPPEVLSDLAIAALVPATAPRWTRALTREETP